MPLEPAELDQDNRGHWIRLETLTRVRWLASAGQLSALLIAWHGFDLRFPLALCLLVVGISAASTLLSYVVYPRSKRLSELESLLTLLFDLCQLALLLFLTGGLNNPFALLMIAPVVISALALSGRSTILLTGLTLLFASLLATRFEALTMADGAPVTMPDLFRFGYWLAICIGIVFIAAYARTVARQKDLLTEALIAMRLALAREQKLTDLGAVVAATAHELGTPLATIKLASAELIDALDDTPQHQDLIEDARLIRDQADRCRQILRSMGQAGKDDRHMRVAPVLSVVQEAAAPHTDRGKTVQVDAQGPDRMPEIQRKPEIIHGLRNLIQNAVDFSAQRVIVTATWSDTRITVDVADDGPGFPPALFARIGEPFLRHRRSGERPEYDGMGLGLFIAKTLLERSGARIAFSNDALGGARAQVVWARGDLEGSTRTALGQNTLNLP